MTANRDLAERARQLADRAPRGSLERKAYGCAAVALSSTTGTLAAARRALGDVGQADVQAAAIEALEQLAGDHRPDDQSERPAGAGRHTHNQG